MMAATILADPDVDGGDVFAFCCTYTKRFRVQIDKGTRVYNFDTAEPYVEKMQALRSRGYIFPDSAIENLERLL